LYEKLHAALPSGSEKFLEDATKAPCAAAQKHALPKALIAGPLGGP